jgi:hypothetical protein
LYLGVIKNYCPSSITSATSGASCCKHATLITSTCASHIVSATGSHLVPA